MSTKIFPAMLALLLLSGTAVTANASTFEFTFAGSGVSGDITLTYGSLTDAKYPGAYEITDASGTFSDSNLGIVDAYIYGVEPLNRISPEPTNTLAPNDFSGFAVASGLSPYDHGILHYDNLFYPGGSPQTASDYPPHGGIFDIYGLLFDLGEGTVVNLWSNGLPDPNNPTYGVIVATPENALDQVPDGVTVNTAAATPEPGTLSLLGTGAVALLWRRRQFRLR